MKCQFKGCKSTEGDLTEGSQVILCLEHLQILNRAPTMNKLLDDIWIFSNMIKAAIQIGNIEKAEEYSRSHCHRERLLREQAEEFIKNGGTLKCL